MSNDAASDTGRLKRAVETARIKRNRDRIIAYVWTLAAAIMWFGVASGYDSSLAGGIAFSGVAFMYWSVAKASSNNYDETVKKLSQLSK